MKLEEKTKSMTINMFKDVKEDMNRLLNELQEDIKSWVFFEKVNLGCGNNRINYVYNNRPGLFTTLVEKLHFQWTVDNTKTHNWSKCCESKTECSTLSWTSLSPTHFSRSRECPRRGNGKNGRPRAHEECYRMQSSGPDMTIALLNS